MDVKKLNLELYLMIYLIRRCEEKIISIYPTDDMKTPMHMSMGEEAIAAGVCYALRKEDQIFGSYRSHAIYLAKSRDTDDFFAEMYGKDTALLKGKGGSMHMSAAHHGFMGTSGIVASVIPIAVGAAFANKALRNNKYAAVFFGDGATNEGVFWESLNVASLMKLPIIFVCEDNDLAVHTPKSERDGYKSLCDIVSKFNCLVIKEKSTDVEVIYRTIQKGLKLMQQKEMPLFIHVSYYRYLEHVGINEDFNAGYRSKKEFLKWFTKDPVKIQRNKLIEIGLSEKEVQDAERKIEAKIDASILKAQKAAFCEKSELYRGVLA